VNQHQTATDTLSRHAASLRTAELPDDVAAFSRTVLTDTIGVMLAASTQPAVRIAATVMPLADPDGSTVLGRAARLPAPAAAFINGIAGHDIELDDSQSPSRTHAAAVIVAAALAAAEASAKVTGDDLLAGVVAGYDVQVRVSKAMGVQRQFDRGFHPTAVCGAIGAAVASARVLSLPAGRTRTAIGLAASQSSGLMTFEEDASHMVKSFQTGTAARNGVYAALFARAGFQAAPDVLTGRHNVLVPFGGPSPDDGQLVDALGVRYDITKTSLKRHACCGQTHAAVDAMLAVQAEHGIRCEDITDVDVRLAHNAVEMVDGNPLWTHNIQYVLALAAHQGAVRPEHFTAEWTTNRQILDLAARVHVRGDDMLQSRFPAKKGAILTVRTADHTLTRECPMPVGNPDIPLSQAEIRDKFCGLAGTVLPSSRVTALWALLAQLGAATPMPQLFRLAGAFDGAELGR
jgi:2-methylcitrate dehydratase PrpD